MINDNHNFGILDFQVSWLSSGLSIKFSGHAKFSVDVQFFRFLYQSLFLYPNFNPQGPGPFAKWKDPGGGGLL